MIMIVQVCIGSSCHIKDSYEIVDLLQKSIHKNGYENDVTLSGSFCIGKCNRLGVTILVDDKIATQITKENFREFWNQYIVNGIQSERKGDDGRNFTTKKVQL